MLSVLANDDPYGVFVIDPQSRVVMTTEESTEVTIQVGNIWTFENYALISSALIPPQSSQHHTWTWIHTKIFVMFWFHWWLQKLVKLKWCDGTENGEILEQEYLGIIMYGYIIKFTSDILFLERRFIKIKHKQLYYFQFEILFPADFQRQRYRWRCGSDVCHPEFQRGAHKSSSPR